MITDYKYNPEDFTGVLNLSDDLSNFYKSLEKYRRTNELKDWVERHSHWEDLLFTIKGREVEGRLNPVIAGEMRSYLEVLAND